MATKILFESFSDAALLDAENFTLNSHQNHRTGYCHELEEIPDLDPHLLEASPAWQHLHPIRPPILFRAFQQPVEGMVLPPAPEAVDSENSEGTTQKILRDMDFGEESMLPADQLRHHGEANAR
jgi:hypothetical protein